MSKKKKYSPEAKFGGIVKNQLKSVKDDLVTIKEQLNGISTAIDDLTERIGEIEKILKEKKVKVA